MPTDGAGYFTRLFDFKQDRDNGIRILASRVDAELDNIAEALNTPVTTEKLTYGGESLAVIFDRILSKLGARVDADDVTFGTTTVYAELVALRAFVNNQVAGVSNRVSVLEAKEYDASEISFNDTTLYAALTDAINAIEALRNPDPNLTPDTEGYWSNGSNNISELTWTPNASVTSEGAWRP